MTFRFFCTRSIFSQRFQLNFYSWLLSLGLIPAAVQNVPWGRAGIRHNPLTPATCPQVAVLNTSDRS
jgi:hypothetical protein